VINHYYFDNQLRQYLLQFVSIFWGLQVQTGKGECDEQQFITVPVVVGNKDRVVAALLAGNTQNRMFSVPHMSAYLQGLALAPERRRAPGMLDQRVTMKVGGVFPDDLTVVKRAMPVPYNATIELAIYASNTQQMHQLLEQILVLFNPDLQIQKSDGPFDWTRLTNVELTDISNEENYPSSTERRMVIWTLTFTVPIYLSVPLGVRDDLVRKVIIQIGSLNEMSVNEVGPDGNIQPFGTPLATITTDTTVPGLTTENLADIRPLQGEEPFPPEVLP
jgi:T4-like virus Myoviridae tail sheath stabiliser